MWLPLTPTLSPKGGEGAGRGGRIGHWSVGVGADDFAASAGAEGLIDGDAAADGESNGPGLIRTGDVAGAARGNRHISGGVVAPFNCHDWVEFLRKWTEPSLKPKLAPPGW